MRRRPPHAAALQRGAAALLLLALLGIVLPLMLALSHRPPRPEELARQRSLQSLLMAREALLARAVKGRRDSFRPGDIPVYRPGSLPCPDVDDDGDADGSHCFGYLGRLPYKTLEIDDLRDGTGERLWYALSPAFRPARYPLPDTRGQLQLGDRSADSVALLFAPGSALGSQSRSCDDARVRDRCGRLLAANYLEGRNALNAAHDFSAGPARYEARSESSRSDGSFNDLVLDITTDMFMPAVQRRVAQDAVSCLSAISFGVSAGAGVETLPFPPASLWLGSDSPCAGLGVYGFFDAWRPLIRYRIESGMRPEPGARDAAVAPVRAERRIVVTLGEDTVCLRAGGGAC